MTSPSRRKPRTTPRSTPRSITASLAIGLLLGSASGLPAQEATPVGNLFDGPSVTASPRYDYRYDTVDDGSARIQQTGAATPPRRELPPRATDSRTTRSTPRPFVLTGRRDRDTVTAARPTPPDTPRRSHLVQTGPNDPPRPYLDPASAAPAPIPSHTDPAGERTVAWDPEVDADPATADPLDLPETPGTAAPKKDPYALAPIHSIQPFPDYEPEIEYGERSTAVDLFPEPAKWPPPGPYHEYGQLRSPCEITFAWEASNLYSQPLYFDDPKLERYGHTYWWPVQPFVSTGRFGVQLLALPYKATIDPYCKRMYALGWYRPGDCAPQQIEPIPWNTKAAAVQAGATAGAFLVFP